MTQENLAPYAQYQNGVAERHIQTIKDRASTILAASKLNKSMWGEAILCTVVNWNATAGTDKSPFELITGREPDLNPLKPFGCRVFIRIPIEQQQHMGHRAEAGIFIGYAPETKGYKIMKDGRAKTYFIRAPRDCTFKEDIFPGSERNNSHAAEAERAEIINIPIFWENNECKVVPMITVDPPADAAPPQLVTPPPISPV